MKKLNEKVIEVQKEINLLKREFEKKVLTLCKKFACDTGLKNIDVNVYTFNDTDNDYIIDYDVKIDVSI